MLTLRILSGVSAGREIPAGRFPFLIGRHAQSDLSSREPGVWDRHGELDLDLATGFHLRAVGEAEMRVNGEPVREARLRNGDIVDLGGLKFSCTLAAAPQRSMRLREAVFWLGIALVFALQLALVNIFG